MFYTRKMETLSRAPLLSSGPSTAIPFDPPPVSAPAEHGFMMYHKIVCLNFMMMKTEN